MRAALQHAADAGRPRRSSWPSTMRMRIGVNTGEVLVGALRAGGDYTAMGDVVNTASRLQTAARAGRGARRPGHPRGHPPAWSSYEALGAAAGRGREEPVPVWRAVAALSPAGPPPRPQPRRRSWAARPSWACCAAASRRPPSGERAALLLVLGEAGMGKTRLAEEVAAEVPRGARGARARGPVRPLRRGQRVVADRRCAAARRAGSPRATRRTRPSELARAAPPSCAPRPSRARARRRVRPSPEVRARAPRAALPDGLRVALHDDRPGPGPRARPPTRWSPTSSRCAEERLVVLVLSDLHWADDLVLELLDTLLDRLASRRFVIVATARPGIEERWHPPHGRHNLVVLNLDPLDPDAAATLLQRAGRHRPRPEPRRGRPAGPRRRQPLLPRGAGHPARRRRDGRTRRTRPRRVRRWSSPTRSGGWSRPASTASPPTSAGARRLRGARPPRRRRGDRGHGGQAPRHRATCDRSSRRSRPRSSSCSPARAAASAGPSAPTWCARWPTAPSPRPTGPAPTTASPRGWSCTRTSSRDAVVDRITHHYVQAAELAHELGPVDGLFARPRGAVPSTGCERAADRAAHADLHVVAEQLYSEGLRLLGGPTARATARFLDGPGPGAGQPAGAGPGPGRRGGGGRGGAPGGGRCRRRPRRGPPRAGRHRAEGDRAGRRRRRRSTRPASVFHRWATRRARPRCCGSAGFGALFRARVPDRHRRSSRQALARFEELERPARRWRGPSRTWPGARSTRATPAEAEVQLRRAAATFEELDDPAGRGLGAGAAGLDPIPAGPHGGGRARWPRRCCTRTAAEATAGPSG